MNDPTVIIISGQVAAGKTTAGKWLERRGYQYARISQAIRTRWHSAGAGKPTRSWYQKMGMELHNTIGQRALCAETMEFIPDPNSPVVIDGARWKEDIQYFRDRFGSRVRHLHLTADRDVRKRRFEEREKDVTFEEADGDEVEQEIPQLAGEADAVFDNSADDPRHLQGFLEQQLETRRAS